MVVVLGWRLERVEYVVLTVFGILDCGRFRKRESVCVLTQEMEYISFTSNTNLLSLSLACKQARVAYCFYIPF